MKRLLTLTTIFTFLLLPLAALGQVVNPPPGGGGSTITCSTSGGIVYWSGSAYVCSTGGTITSGGAITGTTVTASTALVTTLNANPNAPNIYATSDATTGISISPFTGDTLFISGGVATAGLAGNSGNLRVFMGSSTALQWTSGDNVASTGATLGLSQDASNVMDCGNGTFQNKSCTFNAATFIAGGITIIPTLRGTLSLTAATTDSATITGVTTSSKCTFSPTNSTAAAATVLAFVSSVSANTVVIGHAATVANGGTLNILCSLN